jgi:hypothetical protein
VKEDRFDGRKISEGDREDDGTGKLAMGQIHDSTFQDLISPEKAFVDGRCKGEAGEQRGIESALAGITVSLATCSTGRFARLCLWTGMHSLSQQIQSSTHGDSNRLPAGTQFRTWTTPVCLR